MGSIPAANVGLENLLQTLSSLNSPVLSSPTVMNALEKAPAGDIVQLSVAASQLQGVDEMFGISDGSDTATSSSLVNLDNLLAGSTDATSAGSTSTASSAQQLNNYEAALQTSETQALFGNGTTGNLASSLFDVTG